MFSKIATCSLFLIIAYLIIMSKVPQGEPNIITNQVCKEILGQECTIVYEKAPYPNAYVREGIPVIHLVGGIEKVFTPEELNSVMLHEIAHVALEHARRMDSVVKENGDKMSPVVQCSVARQFEYESDDFAVAMSARYKIPSKLDEAFINHVPGNQRDNLSCSHPTINQRIRRIRNMERIYQVPEEIR